MSDERVGDEGLASAWESTPDEISSIYDTWAAGQYDDDVEGWGYDAPERVASIIAEFLRTGATTGAGVLDAGCGTGRVGTALHSLDITGVIGGDFSEASLATARRRGVYDSVSFLDLNEPLPFDADRFAAVASVGVFSYLADSEATIRELLRVVAPGGGVVFTQRTDLWAERDFDRIVADLGESGACSAVVHDPIPYLPGHPEFGREIEAMVVTLIKLA